MADTLNAGEELVKDQPLVSNGGHVKLVFQGDGNLVLYAERPGGQWLARWASGTDGSDAARCVLDGDGNLILHDDAGNLEWSSAGVVISQVLIPVGAGNVRQVPGRLRPRGGGAGGGAGGGGGNLRPVAPRLVVSDDENVQVLQARLPLWTSGTSLEGRPVKLPDKAEVWGLQGGKRRHIPDPDTLEAQFGGWGNVVELTQAQIDQWPLGDPIPSVIPDISSVQACLDMDVPNGTLAPRQELLMPPRIESDGSVLGVTQQPLVGVPSCFWSVGQVIRVKLMGGSPFVRNKVREFADQWMEHANITFQWVGRDEPAEIRAAFDPGGSWSMLGRWALLIPFDFATMNYGWFDDSTPDSEFSRTVLHEFGHALGFAHEHQSPAAGIAWDREAAYAYYKRTQGWDSGMVDSQVFAKYGVDQTNFSAFDPASIMLYSIPAALTLDGRGTRSNTVLSATDKEFARRWYPFAPTPGASKGLLRTGDDCDEIDFSVTYDHPDTSSVGFALNASSRITWWKAIEIPIGTSGYRMLQIQDGQAASTRIPLNLIDRTRPMRFHKAKEFGKHTLLRFNWDIMKALPGGSTTTFLWKRDRC